MKIALIGTRGVPARYGGFETCAEELGRRLARRGHEVWVYCRSGYYGRRTGFFEGMRLVYLPALPIKFFETPSHTALSLLHILRRRFDILMVFNLANSPLLFLARRPGERIALHLDGLEWTREKWRGPGRMYYQFAARLATRLPVPLISDSREIQKYFRRRFGRGTEYISYGASIEESRHPALLEPFDLRPGSYFLQMARFEPENNILLTIRAFEKLETKMRLALVGGTTYRSKYADEVFATKDPRIRFLGFCYDRDVLRELRTNAFAYIHGNEAGGTNPGLLQAMGAGCFVIARDVPFNREVCGDGAVYFQKHIGELKEKMAWALAHRAELEPPKIRARQIIRARYNWDAVTLDYERLFERICPKRKASRGSVARGAGE